MKRKFVYIGLSVVSFVLCVLIVKVYGVNPLIRGFVGDIVVMWLLYFLLQSFYDFSPHKLTIALLGIAYVTECLQYFKLTTVLGLEHSKLADLILGSVFDMYDLFAYTVGAITVYLTDTIIIRKLH